MAFGCRPRRSKHAELWITFETLCVNIAPATSWIHESLIRSRRANGVVKKESSSYFEDYLLHYSWLELCRSCRVVINIATWLHKHSSHREEEKQFYSAVMSPQTHLKPPHPTYDAAASLSPSWRIQDKSSPRKMIEITLIYLKVT